MVAWAGLELLRSDPSHPDILPADAVPDSIWTHHRSLIGEDKTQRVAEMSWPTKAEVPLYDPSLFYHFLSITPQKPLIPPQHPTPHYM